MLYIAWKSLLFPVTCKLRPILVSENKSVLSHSLALFIGVSCKKAVALLRRQSKSLDTYWEGKWSFSKYASFERDPNGHDLAFENSIPIGEDQLWSKLLFVVCQPYSSSRFRWMRPKVLSGSGVQLYPSQGSPRLSNFIILQTMWLCIQSLSLSSIDFHIKCISCFQLMIIFFWSQLIRYNEPFFYAGSQRYLSEQKSPCGQCTIPEHLEVSVAAKKFPFFEICNPLSIKCLYSKAMNCKSQFTNSILEALRIGEEHEGGNFRILSVYVCVRALRLEFACISFCEKLAWFISLDAA